MSVPDVAVREKLKSLKLTNSIEIFLRNAIHYKTAKKPNGRRTDGIKGKIEIMRSINSKIDDDVDSVAIYHLISFFISESKSFIIFICFVAQNANAINFYIPDPEWNQRTPQHNSSMQTANHKIVSFFFLMFSSLRSHSFFAVDGMADNQ